jgi:hypothetical protein
MSCQNAASSVTSPGGGTREDTEKLYEERYLPADRLYFETVHTELKADVIIDNTDPHQRTFTVRSS